KEVTKVGEAIAVFISLALFILPIFVMIIVYVAVLALIIWFIISFLRNQKERNSLLAEISKSLKKDKPTDLSEQADMESEIMSSEALEDGKDLEVSTDSSADKVTNEFVDESTDYNEQRAFLIINRTSIFKILQSKKELICVYGRNQFR